MNYNMKNLIKNLLLNPFLLGTIIFSTGLKVKAQTPNIYQEDYNFSDSLGQITSVSQLRDVSPTDWAYEALRSLVERYGCIVGYPDRTYRGNRALSRYEFAAGLNVCMQQMERLIASSEAILREDIDKLKRLMKEFETELATLGGRVDNLEGRVAFLEDNQFSTTTKLSGEVILGLSTIFTGDDADGDKAPRVPILGNRTRLYLETSFTGEDTLYTGVATGNMPFYADTTGTFESELSFGQDLENDVIVEWLAYYFPIGENTEILIDAYGGVSDDFADPINFLYGDGTLSLSFFGDKNPIYNYVYGSGFAINHSFNDYIDLSVGYLASLAESPEQGSGLFNGPYGALAQIAVHPTDSLSLGFTYVNAYNQDQFTGSRASNLNTFVVDTFDEDYPTSSNSYGVQMSWKISNGFVLGGWGGYTNLRSLSSLNGTAKRGSQDIWNWAVTLGFPDLFKEGSVGGIVVGMQPKVTDSSIEIPGLRTEDKDTSIHVEGFYKYAINDNIAITPGLIWITAPDHNNNNEDLLMGVIRTTFTF